MLCINLLRGIVLRIRARACVLLPARFCSASCDLTYCNIHHERTRAPKNVCSGFNSSTDCESWKTGPTAGLSQPQCACVRRAGSMLSTTSATEGIEGQCDAWVSS